jgi:hypothetical protein
VGPFLLPPIPRVGVLLRKALFEDGSDAQSETREREASLVG